MSMEVWTGDDDVVVDNDTIIKSKEVEEYSTESMKWLAAQGNAYYCPKDAPVTLKRFLKKNITINCRAVKFDGLNEMVNFMKDNKGLIIHSCVGITMDNLHMDILRYFVKPNGEIVRINWFTNKINKW